MAAALLLLLLSPCAAWGQVPFSLAMDQVNPAHYELTTFATGLGFPVGMAELSDGSLVVAESRDAAYFSTPRGTLTRLADQDGDGVAESRTVLTDQVPFGSLTAVRAIEDLLFVMGTGKPIAAYRFADGLERLVPLGQLELTYTSTWQHRNSALEVRPLGDAQYELFFQIGSDRNLAVTTRTVGLRVAGSGEDAIPLAGDALHRVVVSIDDAGLTILDTQPIASGLRNAAGFAFQPTTGDLYIAENGIDGLVDANEPTSADELNRIMAGQIGNEVVDFGFPERYVEYRTGQLIGGDEPGVDPWVAFQPLPAPVGGSEAEGPNQIAFLPESFPRPLHGGLVVGMHGRFNAGGIANEENPLVFVDGVTGNYDYLIGNDEPGIGHLNGVLSTSDSLYIADFSPQGSLTAAQANSGVIYRMRSKYPAIDTLTDALLAGSNDARYDVNRDGVVDTADFESLVHEIHHTYRGDANLDGVFDSGDLVQVFASAKYEQPGSDAAWADGDWSGDRRFDTLDLIVAFQEGAYEQGPRPDVLPVPEPSGAWLLTSPLLLGLSGRRSAKRASCSACGPASSRCVPRSG